jgi:ribosomal protein S18 acetylase RimI-like enzyme
MIRIARQDPADARAIWDVHYRTWLATYPNAAVGITAEDIIHRFETQMTAEAIADFARRLAGPSDMLRLSAWQDDTLAGVCRVIARPDHLKLQTLYVLPQYQRRGIGRALWDEALRLLGNPGQAIVHVASFNTGAIRFYERLGFADTGKRWINEDIVFRNGAKLPEMEMLRIAAAGEHHAAALGPIRPA